MHNSELPYIYQFSCSLVSNPLWTHGLQLAWLFVHYQIHVNQVGGAIQPSQSSVMPFSSHLQSFLSSGSFSMTRFLASSSQSVGASASALLLLMNIQDWFPLEFIGLISLQSRDKQKSSPTPQFKIIGSSVLCLLYGPTIHHTWLLETANFWL